MFRSLMTVIRVFYLYLTKVIFMSKHSMRLSFIVQEAGWAPGPVRTGAEKLAPTRI